MRQLAGQQFSVTLKNSLYVRKIRDATAIGVPHYWAPYYHDGRGPAPKKMRPGKWMVWFRDPLRNDPRLNGKYPVYKRDVGKLSPEDFQKFMLENARSPGNPIMFVRKSSPVNRAQAVKKNPFFDKAFDVIAANPDLVGDAADSLITAYIDWNTQFRNVAAAQPYSAWKRKTIHVRVRK